MSKYFEGYYCKDDSSVKGIKTEYSRQVLRTISNYYPRGITARQISDKTKIRPDTVRGSLKSLEDAGFINRAKYEGSRGRREDAQDNIRSFRFHIENRNFALNEGEKYQFAPGYTKYTSDFLYAWKVLVEKDQLDSLYPLLIRILRQVMTKITSSEDPLLKQLVPTTEISRDGEKISMQCKNCGVNHDARDFIRAILLHFLDEFERSSQFMEFFSEQQFISNDSYEGHHLLNKEKSKIKEAKEWLNNLSPDAKHDAEPILKKSSLGIEQLMWRVNKLTEPYFDVRVTKNMQIDEQAALSIIRHELHINSDYDSQLHQYKIQPALEDTTVIKVEQTQTKDGIKVTLHKLEFTAECTAAFITVEKTSDDHRTIKFHDSKSIAVQGDYEFTVTSKGPNYKRFRKAINYGTKESGAVKFERLNYNAPAKFEFNFGDAVEVFTPWWLFVFEVQIQK
jgi:predicted transcriptional regulator